LWRTSKSIVREALLTSVTCAWPFGQLPDQPAVDGAEGEVAVRRRDVRAADMVEQPAQLGAEK
jgi:hypothetical protein